MEKMYLYLDDVRTPRDPKWVVVRSFDELVAHVKFNGLENYELISLDHDLGEESMIEYYNNVKTNYTLDYKNIKEEKTGYDVAKFLVNQSIATKISLPLIYVHSANPIGSANIMGYINNYHMNCGQPQTCVRVKIDHYIEEQLQLSPEARKAKWSRPKN